MSYKTPILIVDGQPKSIFLEIFFKSIKKIKIKSPIILIASLKLVSLEMKKQKIKKKIKILDYSNINIKNLNNLHINLIDVSVKSKNVKNKKSSQSNDYIKKKFSVAFDLIKKHKINKFINGPINKKKFLNKKYLGITEYISNKFKSKKNAMLIYNKNLSVCPVTTHLPIKFVTNSINSKIIKEKIILINDFYKKQFKFKPKIALLGLNPHCESIDKYNEDEKILKPVVNYFKKKNFLVFGPFSADTIFLTQNRFKYDVIVGMYHDQVLTPIKTLFEYDAINITLGLPFIRISPDHGPNENMYGKNKSNPLSLMRALKFLDKN